MTDCRAKDTLYVVNYTTQNVNLRFVKIKRNDDGPAKDESGNYVISAASDVKVVTPSANDGDGLTKLSGWGPGTSKGYDGYSAQTADGVYSVTASLTDDFDYDQGDPCFTAYAYLCFDDGTGRKCYSSNGSGMEGFDSKPMTKGGQYVTSVSHSKKKMLLLLLFIVIIVILAGGGYYYYRHHHMT
jgi:hypothetical protein